jgi:hypothetical protein
MANNIDQLKGVVSAKKGFAAPNLFRVFLPTFANVGSMEVDMLCSSVNMPGRQIMTVERKIGSIFEKVAYDQAYDDVNLSFYVLNDYGIRKYFEAWQNLALDQDTYTVGYKNEYARDVKIQQLRKGFTLPIYQSPFLTFDFLGGGILDLDIDINIRPEDVVYELELIDAFPTTMDLIQLGNDQNDMVLQLNVQLSYKNWRSNGGDAIRRENNFLLGALIGTINETING